MKKIHIIMVLVIGHSILRTCQITRNEPGTTPKTSRKLKQTMLDLYPDDFSCRSFHTIQDFCELDLDPPTMYPTELAGREAEARKVTPNTFGVARF